MAIFVSSEEKLTFDDVLLVPQYSEVMSRSDVSTGTTLSRITKLKIPVIAANMDTVCEVAMALEMHRLGGMGVLHRFNTIEQQCGLAEEIIDKDPDAVFAAAIGVDGNAMARVMGLIETGVKRFCVDVAHGDSFYAANTVRQIRLFADRESLEIDIIAGNVVTPEAVRGLSEAGANIVKIGVGPGTFCDTRQVAGTGYPQMSAILDCAESKFRQGATLIADGGIKTSGDAAKALAAGADAVMLGGLLTGTLEAPGEVIETDNGLFKLGRGMASLEALRERDARTGEVTDVSNYAPEGVEALIPYKGPVENTLNPFMAGVRSAMSYQGVFTIKDFQAKARFVKVSPTTLAENRPRV